MSINPLARFALAGLIGAGIGTHSACAAEGGDGMAGGDTGTESNEEKYREVHDCAGLNVCKGLGGCKVTAEKFAALKAKKDAAAKEEEAGTME